MSPVRPNIVIVTPAHQTAHTGNRTTSLRWKSLLHKSGHRIQMLRADDRPRDCDVLIAVHAGHSARHVLQFRRQFPTRPIVLAIAGTDLYSALRRSQRAQECLKTADRVVVLQPCAVAELPKSVRAKCRVIFQSAELPNETVTHRADGFDVCVIGHLRPVKDPFRAAMAVRRLPRESSIRVTHLGAAFSESMRNRATRETANNARYEWCGELSWRQTITRLRGSRLLVLSSKTEGGANVVSESIVAGVPVLSSRIPGSVGLLGDHYAGYFPTGGTAELRSLLLRAENEPDFLASLQNQIHSRQPLFAPSREQESWDRLLRELTNG